MAFCQHPVGGLRDFLIKYAYRKTYGFVCILLKIRKGFIYNLIAKYSSKN